ncbi:hypothetical protein [Sciscionella sediminilitoris]|uniref:hypothetical protein n=1 Tax=Sciscionella sediminilitoris TaxID=1445613 RepID=UPI0004DF259F|nr:hypothetical protein [Sciscionella sp. SE31]
MRAGVRVGTAVAIASIAIAGSIGTAGAATGGDAPGLKAAVDKLKQDVTRLEKGLQAKGIRTETGNSLLDTGSGSRAGCTPGALLGWADQLKKAMSETEQQGSDLLGSLAFDYAGSVAEQGPDQKFGTDGQYTGQSTKTMDKLRSFWDIQSKDIQLVPAHGTDLADSAKVTKLFSLVDGAEQAKTDAADVRSVLTKIPELKNGRNPVLTFNAYSAPGPDKRIELGDGILDAAAKFGFGSIGVPVVLAHEYGHQNQFANNYAASGPALEMGADAFSGYFVTHPNGMGFDSATQGKANELSSSIGDCQDDHGSPQQRSAATQWGEKQYADQQDPKAIRPSAEFITAWQKEFPVLHPDGARKS